LCTLFLFMYLCEWIKDLVAIDKLRIKDLGSSPNLFGTKSFDLSFNVKKCNKSIEIQQTFLNLRKFSFKKVYFVNLNYFETN